MLPSLPIIIAIRSSQFLMSPLETFPKFFRPLSILSYRQMPHALIIDYNTVLKRLTQIFDKIFDLRFPAACVGEDAHGVNYASLSRADDGKLVYLMIFGGQFLPVAMLST